MIGAIPSQLSAPLQPTILSNGQDARMDVGIHSGSKSLGSSPILGRRDVNSGSPDSSLSSPHSTSSSSLLTEVAAPVPAPRGSSLLHPQQAPQDMSQSTNPISPLAKSHISAHSIAGNSPGASVEAIPLAIAVIESCNAIFRGVELEDCIVRVTGEVAMSFPMTTFPRLASCEPLTFRVQQKNVEVVRMLHNQHLLNK